MDIKTTSTHSLSGAIIVSTVTMALQSRTSRHMARRSLPVVGYRRVNVAGELHLEGAQRGHVNALNVQSLRASEQLFSGNRRRLFLWWRPAWCQLV